LIHNTLLHPPQIAVQVKSAALARQTQAESERTPS